MSSSFCTETFSIHCTCKYSNLLAEECNNSIFNKKHFLQSDGTAQGPHMPCFYRDIAIQYFDVKALDYTPTIICWKRFRDDIFIVWLHSIDELDIFFDYMNKVDPTKKIQFTTEVAKKVKKQFSNIKKLTRKEARKPKLLKKSFSTS